MEHFVAYHSVRTMGYPLEPSGELRFISRKLALLKRAIGQTVWIVQGEPQKSGTIFTLIGSYRANAVMVDDSDSGLYVINGSGVDCLPPFQLNDVPWFALLKKEQSNFSLGFNVVKNEEVIAELTQLMSLENAQLLDKLDFESDSELGVTEGASLLVSHFRRERNSGLVNLKKQQVEADKGSLGCEICGFDFEKVYGAVGVGFCEVHHRLPLGERFVESQTTLADLAILCANCHRIIHRLSPGLTVEQMREQFFGAGRIVQN